MADKITTSQAEDSLKQISKEAIALEASSIISLYEIDLSQVKLNLNLNSSTVFGDAGLPEVIRFHNEESLNQTRISFRSEMYHPMPIITDGFEVNSNGSLPRPSLTLTSLKGILNEADSNTYFGSLKSAILELDNMLGAKVTRIRTFYKFLDSGNNLPGVGDYTGSVNPEFPKETYFIERKVNEDKNAIQFELSSVLDAENFNLPSRTCVANRCPWVYRGDGCCYEFKNLGSEAAHGATGHLPDFAPPIANDQDEHMTGIISGYDPTAVTSSNVYDYTGLYPKVYATGDVAWIEKEGVKYYYVAKTDVPSDFPPPHTTYWEADRCSKSLEGCKIRWGTAGSAKKYTNPPATDTGPANTFLPFGGFPGTNTRTSVQ